MPLLRAAIISRARHDIIICLRRHFHADAADAIVSEPPPFRFICCRLMPPFAIISDVATLRHFTPPMPMAFMMLMIRREEFTRHFY